MSDEEYVLRPRNKSSPADDKTSSLTASLDWLRSEFQRGVNQVLSVTPLQPVEKGKCPLCQHLSVNLCWQIQLLDGSRYDAVCLNCGGKVQDLVREFEEKD